MPRLIVIEADGQTHTLDASDGLTVMQVATGAGLAGIVAECGGSAMCATCHVYVDEAWQDRLPAALSNELELLDCTAAERLPGSRLSCQIRLDASVDGLVVRLPDRQQ